MRNAARKRARDDDGRRARTSTGGWRGSGDGDDGGAREGGEKCGMRES